MIDELVAAVSERTGIAPDKARAAVDTMVQTLKSHLPPAMANHVDGLLAGTIPSASSIGDSITNVESTLKSKLGGLFS
jgi:hypothetical protein